MPPDALGVVEAALEAWTDCQPDSYTLPEHCIPALLPAIASRLPCDRATSSSANESRQGEEGELPDACLCREPGLDLGPLLRPQLGQVHFLHFWRAFSEASEAAHALASSSSAGEASSESIPGGTAESNGEEEGLAAELVALRDVLLQALEAKGSHTLSASSLLEAVYGAAETSTAPGFWRVVAASVAAETDVNELSLDELTVVLLAWLHDAVVWQHAPASNIHIAASPQQPTMRGASDRSPESSEQALSPLANPRRDSRAEPDEPDVRQTLFSRTAMLLLDDPDVDLPTGEAAQDVNFRSAMLYFGSTTPCSNSRAASAAAEDIAERSMAPGTPLPPRALTPMPPTAPPPVLRLEENAEAAADVVGRPAGAVCGAGPGDGGQSLLSTTARLPSLLTPEGASSEASSWYGHLRTVLQASPVASPRSKRDCNSGTDTQQDEQLPHGGESHGGVPGAADSDAQDGNQRTAMLAFSPMSRMQVLQDALISVAGECEPAVSIETEPASNFRTAMLPQSPAPQEEACSPPTHRDRGLAVLLHVYDVSQENSIQRLNTVLANRMSPLKLGGVFHAGVEVNRLEWSFGFSTDPVRIPGVQSVQPRTHPHHHFRQTVHLRRTRASEEDIDKTIDDLRKEYPGPDYDLLRRNCCHFADDFCQRLGVGRIPSWVHRLARIGARIDGVLGVQQRVGSRGATHGDMNGGPDLRHIGRLRSGSFAGSTSGSTSGC